MRMMRHLIDCAAMLRNQCDHRTLRVTLPECAPLEEIMQKSDKEEDEDDVKVDNWRMDRGNKRSGNKRASEEVENDRSTNICLENDSEEHEECEEEDDTHW